MKKFFIILLFIFTMLIASCSNGNSQDLEGLRTDKVSEEKKTELNINFDEKTNSICLNPIEEETKNYYSIYVSENTIDSLFTYRVDFDEYINKHLKSAPVSCLTFKDSLYADEMTSYVSTLYNKENGISKLSLGFDINDEAKWTKSANVEHLLDVKNDGKTGVKLAVTYLPTYFVRNYGGNEILKVYVFVPVYIAFEVDGLEITDSNTADLTYSLVESTTAKFKEVNLQFKENTETEPNNNLFLKNE